ncbi:hypothetical protein NKR23_g8546 [Pleurostoma richardsiae]|uniref:CENP-V/GFA domain-containing protein n=1 Tax=Pleurostoma richardsiae TaxID=41990 RepID=A0AA38RQN4_9PEZI|nr:hypothetical protein NKR23_g8546 [Pleurostoma richardsiae]
MASPTEFPTPKFVTGGCLCGALRYRVDFPKEHDFKKMSSTCQCTQCRRNTGSLFFPCHSVEPASGFTWLTRGPEPQSFSQPPAQFRTYSASPGRYRGFCDTCGSFITYHKDGSDGLSVLVGTVDPLYLWGEGADGTTEVEGQVVPREGYGLALVGGFGSNEFCGNEIKGVTDGLPLLGVGRGQRFEGDMDA